MAVTDILLSLEASTVHTCHLVVDRLTISM